ncbi:Holliday junction ATP-dependent DNA helicase RuvA [Bienertia sinuspersici]
MDELMPEDQTQEVVEMMKAIDLRMDQLEEKEEAYWRQRSRQCWLQGGYRNSRFFHEKADQRRERNSILQVKDEAGNIFEEEEEISEVFVVLEDGLLGLGAVLRDNEGDVLMVMCDTWRGDCTVEMAEALAVRQGIKVAIEAGFRSFGVESDSLILVKALKNGKQMAMPFGLIVKDPM